MQELQLLSERLDLLLKRYATLQAENKKLKQTIAGQTQNIATLNVKLSALEQQLVAVQIGKSIPDEQERGKMRRQLDTVIGEIDKILATLND